MAFSELVLRRLQYGMGDDAAGEEVYKRLNGQTAPTNKVNGGATPTVMHRFGLTETEGTELRVIDEVVTMTASAVETALTNQIPANSVVLSVQTNIQQTVVGSADNDDAAAKIAIGISGTITKYGVTADLIKNTKVDKVPSSWAVLGSAETVNVKLVKSDSSACTETAASGKVRVRIVYLALNSLDDAA